MTALPFKYTRLARPAAGVGSYHSLWLGSDHLLQVRSTGWSEDYQQFMFSDIRGIFVGGSKRRANWNLAWGLYTAICGIVLASTWDGTVPYVAAIFTLVGLVVIAINTWVLGPSCNVYLVTQVQTAELRALKRLRKASRVLERVGPLILASQSRPTGDPAPPLPATP